MSQGQLIAFAREELLRKIAGAEGRIWLASPFLTFPVAKRIGDAARESTAGDRRLLTALDDRSVEVGVLDPNALDQLADTGFEIASIDNLHAKVSLIGSGWGLVGSGNLTGKGLGDEAGGGNHELGVILTDEQVEEASAFFADWWKVAQQVTADEIAAYKLLPRVHGKGLGSVGPSLPVADVAQLQRLLADKSELDGSERYWIDANYHDPSNETWWHRDWISGQPEVAYSEGDLIVLYLGKKYGGPGRCPAILRATTSTRPDPAWVAANRDDPEAPERWPNVTRTTILAEVPVTAGIPLEIIGKTGQSLRRGFLEITRAQFDKLAQATIEPI
ncbi:MAG TPA: phospholipase D-like domain-containing protein [Solirubrobacterales bacterium]